MQKQRTNFPRLKQANVQKWPQEHKDESSLFVHVIRMPTWNFKLTASTGMVLMQSKISSLV